MTVLTTKLFMKLWLMKMLCWFRLLVKSSSLLCSRQWLIHLLLFTLYCSSSWLFSDLSNSERISFEEISFASNWIVHCSFSLLALLCCWNHCSWIIWFLFFLFWFSLFSGITQDIPSPLMRRRLILIAKVISNMSTQVKFGEKEEYMKVMNDYLDSKKDQFDKFYEHVCKVSSFSLFSFLF